MADAKQCDRCGKYYPVELPSIKYDEEWWRYEIRKDCYPYSYDDRVELCIECRKKLYKWIKGGDTE